MRKTKDIKSDKTIITFTEREQQMEDFVYNREKTPLFVVE